MVKVYVVTEETGSYEQTSWRVMGVFTTRQVAEEYVANMTALPGIVAEYSPGRENAYTVDEQEVWTDAPERVMRWHLWKIVGPYTEDRERPSRTETYYPVGYRQDLRAELQVSESPQWCNIYVTAASEAECMAEYRRLLAGWRAKHPYTPRAKVGVV